MLVFDALLPFALATTGATPAANVDLGQFAWFPLKSVESERTAIGVERQVEGPLRRVAMLQMGLTTSVGAAIDNQLMIVDADCKRKQWRNINMFSVDSALETVTPLGGPLMETIREHEASGDSGPIAFGDGVLGDVWRWACDDEAVAAGRTVPLADLTRADSFIERGN